MTKTSTFEGVQAIAIEEIVVLRNDRTTFDAAKIEALARSIADNGLAQPITLRRRQDGRYEIVAGERRLRAMRMLQWPVVPAIVRAITDRQAAEIMLAENTARVDLNPAEEARAYQARLDAGASVTEVARSGAVSATRVKRRLALLGLEKSILGAVETGALPVAIAERVIGLNYDRQVMSLRAYTTNDMSPAQFDLLLSKMREAQNAEAESPLFELEVQQWAAEAKAKRRYGYVGELRVAVERLTAALGSRDDLSTGEELLLAEVLQLVADHNGRVPG